VVILKQLFDNFNVLNKTTRKDIFDVQFKKKNKKKAREGFYFSSLRKKIFRLAISKFSVKIRAANPLFAL